MKLNLIYELLEHQYKTGRLSESLSYKEKGAWNSLSTNDFLENVNKLSYALIQKGVKKGTKIGIMSNNRPEWNILDFAIHQIGAVNVSVYPTLSSKDLNYIFNLTEVEWVFVSDGKIFEKVNSLKEGISSIKNIYSFDSVNNVNHWSTLLDEESDVYDISIIEERKRSLHTDDLASIIFTSGSTGTPKGAMLSNKNFIKAVESLSPCLPLDNGQVALSFLPLCHMFERVLIYTYIYNGLSIYYAESFDKVKENILEVKPHMFTFVPRIIEKIYDDILVKGNSLTGVKKKMFFWALDLAKEYDDQGKNSYWYNLKIKFARNVIFKRWKQALGGRVIGIPCGGAALKPGLAKIFNAAGIYIIEGYGMTEFPVLCANRYNSGEFYHGTVGPPIPGNELKIDETTGEILVRNPDIIMAGYYKKPELTKQMINEEGWLRTGDKGEFVEEKYLKITGRIKDIFKTSTGKYVVPNYLEGMFLKSEFIEQIMVVGENKNFVSALIVPYYPILEQWCNGQGIKLSSKSELIHRPEVFELIQSEVDKINQDLSSFEQVKKFVLLPNEWTVEGGELTPTMKLRRSLTQDKYASLVNEIY